MTRATRRDAPPRLSVIIPDSTMDRASKIFQSVYLAHELPKQGWTYPTPPSSTVERKPLTSITRAVTAPVLRQLGTNGFVARGEMYTCSQGKVLAFPIPPGFTTPVSCSSLSDVDESEYDSEYGTEYETDEEGWEETPILGKLRISPGEPVWEMIAPPRKVNTA